MFGQLHGKMETAVGGKFHTLSQGLREEVERESQGRHQWEGYNVDQLVRGEGGKRGGREWEEGGRGGGGGENQGNGMTLISC